MRESFKLVKDDLDQFRFKFPEKFYVCSHDEKSDKEPKSNTEHNLHFIATDIASCFSVIREEAIRLWDINSI